MITALIHSDSMARPAGGWRFRVPALDSLAGHSLWHGMATTASHVAFGGLALMAAWGLAIAAGIPADLLPGLFLAGGAFVWLALALDSERPLLIGIAAANLAAMTAGAYAFSAGSLSMVPLYGAHLFLLGVALLGRDAGRAPLARIWAGVELTALALMVV